MRRPTARAVLGTMVGSRGRAGSDGQGRRGLERRVDEGGVGWRLKAAGKADAPTPTPGALADNGFQPTSCALAAARQPTTRPTACNASLNRAFLHLP